MLLAEVLPERPLRQWVLSLPYALRFLLATDPDSLTLVLRTVYRVISGFLLKKAGLTRATGHPGAVTLIQRFGSALNLNSHFHMIFLDGVGIAMTDYKARMATSLKMQCQESARKGILLVRSGTAAPVNGPGDSYFGGLPRLPPELQWPQGEVDGELVPLSFAAQIRLDDLPSVPGRGALPASGTLYFFQSYVDTRRDKESLPCRILFYPGTERFAEREPPEELTYFYEDDTFDFADRGWLPEDDPRRRVEFRYPISFAIADTYDDRADVRDYPAVYQATADIDIHDHTRWNQAHARAADAAEVLFEEFRAQAVTEALGPPPRSNYSVNSGAPIGASFEAFLADASWPFVWGMIGFHAERPARSAEVLQTRLTNSASEQLKAQREKYGEPYFEEVRAIFEESLEWLEKPWEYDELDAVPPADAQAYRAWIARIWNLERKYAPFTNDADLLSALTMNHVNLGCFFANRCCEKGHHDKVPARWLDLLREWASWVDRELPDRAFTQSWFEMHQMLGNWKHDHCRVEQGSCAEDDVLLLQIGGSEQLMLNPHLESVLHYVISAEALASRDFSAVRLYD